ncbi:MAG: Smr/MutS family protein [Gammaproteobacteria bacterium]|nr:Smr/MutS family protein [Gammaproteobacteria bacterium]
MAKKRDISAEEYALFRASMEGVTPLPPRQPAPHAPPAPPPRPRQQEEETAPLRDDMLSDALAPAQLEGGEELLFSRNGLQHSVLRKLRRGHYRIGAELDLHGLRVEEARQALSHFLHRSLEEKRQCVRIIHGKGHSSQQNLPVLKVKVNHWLRQRDEVLAFCSARPADGGTGAVYVLLRRK